MAISIDDWRECSSRPLRVDTTRLWVDAQASNLPSLSASLSSIRPPSPYHTLPVQQPSNEQRTVDLDRQVVANLDSFGRQQSVERTTDFTFLSDGWSPFRNPLGAIHEGRRHTVASPELPFGKNLRYRHPQGPRRRSAPNIRCSPAPRTPSDVHSFCVVPKLLSRPTNPGQLSCGTKIWWPFIPNGDMKIHVAITARSGLTERLTRCVPPQLFEMHIAPIGSHERERKTSFPAPGTVLPVPGTTPTTPYSAVYLNRRFSVAPASSPLSPRSPTSSRRGSQVHFELAREFITRDRALQQLPILGSILVQTKRPIQYDETILLPVPYPSAWTETIRYIETNNAEYLSESVKVNILNLGGKLPCA